MPDVAREAGVSIKTVSRVVNGESGVKADTQARVLDAVVRLGFRPNDMARGLRSRQTSASLGLVIGDVANPFYSAIARAAERHARARGFMLIVANSDEDPAREHDVVEALLERRVDGLLIVTTGAQLPHLRAEMEMGTPVVFLDRPPEGLRADSVVIDNRAGARSGVEHLLALGHRRIAFVGDDPSIYTARERLAGYKDALDGAGVAYDEAIVYLGPHAPDEAEAATRVLFDAKKPPTAVFATNNRTTTGVLRALWHDGIDADVVGFDDFELADLLPLPFTVVAHDPFEMGAQAIRLLFERLDGGARRRARTVVLPTTLVPRGLPASVATGRRRRRR